MAADDLDELDDQTMPSARAPRAREDADAGVRDIVDLMTTGRWVTGRSHEAIAEKHGVHPETVKKWATNASRIIRFALNGDALETVRTEMIATLQSVVRVAMTGDLRTAVAAIDLQAKLLGLIVQKHEVQMSETEARQVLEDAKRIISAGADA